MRIGVRMMYKSIPYPYRVYGECMNLYKMRKYTVLHILTGIQIHTTLRDKEIVDESLSERNQKHEIISTIYTI